MQCGVFLTIFLVTRPVTYHSKSNIHSVLNTGLISFSIVNSLRKGRAYTSKVNQHKMVGEDDAPSPSAQNQDQDAKNKPI